MKDKDVVKPSVSEIVCGYIGKHRLLGRDTDKADCLAIIKEIKKVHPESKCAKKNDVDYVRWYFSRLRRQKALGLPTDHLVVIPKGARAKAGRKHGAKAKAKGAVKARTHAKAPAKDAVETVA